jgi:hypothetical protein
MVSLSVTSIQISQFRHEQRYHILPAYTQDGIILARVFQGSTDSTVFEGFIEQLLPLCGKWPEPKSVLVMDNDPFHHAKRIEEMYHDAGVKLVYLPGQRKAWTTNRQSTTFSWLIKLERRYPELEICWGNSHIDACKGLPWAGKGRHSQ